MRTSHWNLAVELVLLAALFVALGLLVVSVGVTFIWAGTTVESLAEEVGEDARIPRWLYLMILAEVGVAVGSISFTAWAARRWLVRAEEPMANR